MDPNIARMLAHQDAVMREREAKAATQPIARPAFPMPKFHTKTEMMRAFIEDRQYEPDSIERPDREEKIDPTNIFDLALSGHDDNAGLPAMFDGPAQYDAGFIERQLMKEQPEEYLSDRKSDDDDDDDAGPFDLFRTARNRTQGMVRSIMA